MFSVETHSFLPDDQGDGGEGTRPPGHKVLVDGASGERLAHFTQLRLAASSHAQVEFCGEALMQGPTVCAQCDLPEDRCACEKYCTICKGQVNVRLCSDGLYYCPDCREACEVSLATSRGR